MFGYFKLSKIIINNYQTIPKLFRIIYNYFQLFSTIFNYIQLFSAIFSYFQLFQTIRIYYELLSNYTKIISNYM